MPTKILDEDGIEGWRYSKEEIEELRVEFGKKFGLTPEEFLKIYNPPSGDHPRFPGLTDTETHIEVWNAKFIVEGNDE